MKPTPTHTCKNSWKFRTLLLPLLLLAAAQFSFAGSTENVQESENNLTKTKISSTAPTPAPLPHTNPSSFQNWDPYAEIQAMREQMNRIFNEFDNRLQMSPFFREDRLPFAIEPDTDIEETANKYIVTMDIPGADNGKIQVKLEQNILSVSAVTMQKCTETKDRDYIRMERSSGSIHRTIALPAPVDNESITSNYKDGILTITVQKKA